MRAIRMMTRCWASMAACSVLASALAVAGEPEQPADVAWADAAAVTALTAQLPPDLVYLADAPVAASDGSSAPRSAPRTEIPFSPTFFKLGFADVGHVFSAPVRWESPEWKRFGMYALAVVGTGVVLDRPVRDAVGGDPEADYGLLSDIEKLGTRSYTLKLLGGIWLYGAARGDEDDKAAAIDGLISAVIAHGLITAPMKKVAGRARPFQEQGPDSFDPFSDNPDNRSFPSGHATEAFAVASALAAHSDQRWFRVLCYGLAGTVGYARLRHDAHWTSDVLAGALIGTTIGREVAAFNTGRRAERGAEVAFESGQVLVTWRY